MPKPVAVAPGLHVVATPIGNLGDITLRAIAVLEQADVIACEDARVTGKLKKAYGIDTPMTPYHEHNAGRARPGLLTRLKRGEIVALVSDAGTPLISDPGYRLGAEAAAEGITVTVVPGATAPVAALVASGLATDRFLFAGFLPSRAAARRKALAELAQVRASLVFLESPRRLAASLGDMAAALGARDAAVIRELTKLHEEIRRGTLPELAAHYGSSGTPKGEVVVVVGAATDDENADAAESLDALLETALKNQSVRDAAQVVAIATGLPRRQVYGRALEMSGGQPGPGPSKNPSRR